MKRKAIHYEIDLDPQPTETTCGPTCLHGIFEYLDLPATRETLIEGIRYNSVGGGTLGVHLGNYALKMGLDVTIYTHNINVFDPTWIYLSKEEVIEKLKLQCLAKPNTRVEEASHHYAQFLEKNGSIDFTELNPEFLYDILEKNGPIICGLSATYFYLCEREIDDTNEFDDVKGIPQGHFVIISGIKADLSEVEITDPLDENPRYPGRKYWVPIQHFLNSVLIGVITYDANILTIKKNKK